MTYWIRPDEAQVGENRNRWQEMAGDGWCDEAQRAR